MRPSATRGSPPGDQPQGQEIKGFGRHEEQGERAGDGYGVGGIRGDIDEVPAHEIEVEHAHAKGEESGETS